MSENRDARGIVLFARGSSVEEANRGVHNLAAQIEARGPYGYVRAAFLEIAHPDLAEAIERSAQAGLRRVLVIPFFLTMGIHLQRDLPHLIAPLRKKYPGLEIEVAQSLEGHPLLESIILERAQEVLNAREGHR